MIGCLLEFQRGKNGGYQLLRTRSNFLKSVRISFGMSSLGCTHVIFIDPGVKNNGEYYRDVLLGEHLLPAIKELSDSELFRFHHNSAPTLRARETVDQHIIDNAINE